MIDRLLRIRKSDRVLRIPYLLVARCARRIGLVAILFLVAGCANEVSKDASGLTPEDEAVLIALGDFIGNATETERSANPAFYVQVNSEDVSPGLLQHLRVRFPNVLPRDEFEIRYENPSHTWGWYGASVEEVGEQSAMVVTWTSKWRDGLKYFLTRDGKGWRIDRTERYVPG